MGAGRERAVPFGIALKKAVPICEEGGLAQFNFKGPLVQQAWVRKPRPVRYLLQGKSSTPAC